MYQETLQKERKIKKENNNVNKKKSKGIFKKILITLCVLFIMGASSLRDFTIWTIQWF